MGRVHWQMGQTHTRLDFIGTRGTKQSSNHMRDLAGYTAAGVIHECLNLSQSGWRARTVVASWTNSGSEISFGLDLVLAANWQRA